MQSVSAAFTAEERDQVRNISSSLQVSWKKFLNTTSRTFTIGVSTIGGQNVIGANVGAVGSPGLYQYYNESDYVMSLAWERKLNMPSGGLSVALAEARLDNTTDRFTPRYMGGNSELFTAILPRRPLIIAGGFEVDGIPNVIPQFTGVLRRQPKVDRRSKTIDLQAADYNDFFQNRFLDTEVMVTSVFADTIMENLLRDSLGLSTSQYVLDQSINPIPFALFEKGTRYAQIFDDLAQAENGNFYQDELGVFRFENRQHWDSAPYNAVQRILLTGQVIESEAPDDDHIINVVEIKSPILEKQPSQTVFSLPVLNAIELRAGTSVEQFFAFEDPVLELTHPTNGGADSYYYANTSPTEAGSELTSNITVTNLGTFAKSVKYRFTNTGNSVAYLTRLVLAGRVAKHTTDLYFRDQDSSSVTAYEERVYSLENPYIQSLDWARSFSGMILNDFGAPENLQKITIRAIPELQLGDLVSWQGRYWRIFEIKANLSPQGGFVQDLTMLQRTITSYFRIGISTIGSGDKIAP